MKRGDTVKFTIPARFEWSNNAIRVEAIIRTIHKDGTVTIQSTHLLDSAGRPVAPYKNFKARIEPRELV